MENATNKYVFVREVTTLVHNYLSHLPSGFKHTFLIRDPSRTYVSFRKVMISKFSTDLPADFDIARDDVFQIKPFDWFEKQHKFWKYVVDNLDPNPVIIDAHDLLSRPGPTLRNYCEAVGFPYSDDLLQWEASLEFPKNMITAGDQIYKDMLDFYDTALNSTHFMAHRESGPVPRDQLTDDVMRCVDHSMPFYREMYEEKLKL